jgi:hypothetical protein
MLHEVKRIVMHECPDRPLRRKLVSQVFDRVLQ